MIRKYEDSDLISVINIWHQTAEAAYSFMSGDMINSIREDIKTKYMPNSQSWVALRDGKVVGFIALLENTVGGLFVSPQYQGQGIGKSLVEHVKSANGSISLDVLKQSTKALNFYKKCGFTPTKDGVCPVTGGQTVTVVSGF